MSSNDWRDVRVLVTGARGFIGAQLCRRLAEAGAILHAVSSRAEFKDPSAAVCWSGVDLADAGNVRRLVEQARPDVVFHLAGHVTGSQELGHVEATFRVNLASTVHLLTTAVEAGRCRVVLAGSMQEPDDDPKAIPCSPYAASKWACNGYARMFHHLYQLPVVIARPMMVYGPGQWDVSKLLPYVTTSLLSGTAPSVSSGARTLDWVFIDDVVTGMMMLAKGTTIVGQTIDLGSGVLTSIREIVERVATLVGSEVSVRFGAVPDRPFERPRAAQVIETQRLLGWSPKVPLDEGLIRTVAWYRETWSSLKPA